VRVIVEELKMEWAAKKGPNGKFHNKSPVGKPRTRWLDVVRRDISQILGIREWRKCSRRQRRMEVSSEAGQGPEGAVAPQMEMDGLVKCYIWCIAFYGTETWTFSKVEQKYLETFEMLCWKRM
jgi:hypothetical protein